MSLPKTNYLSEVWKDGIFDGKVVFYTGGSGSICSAQVRALVYLGANACIVGRNIENTESMARDMATARVGAKVLGYGAVDVRNLKLLEGAVPKRVKDLGGIDFVIAGAAGNFLAPLMQLSTNAFKTVLDIDLIGSWNALKATIPYLLESAAKHRTDGKTTFLSGTGGRIIFISATLQYTGIPLQTHILVAKAGVDALAVQVAIELGPRGVTSNIIAPGPIKGTEGMDRLNKNGLNRQSGIPSGRFGSVKEIADAAVYLFSDAGNYVNGEALVVDGGAWHVHGGDVGTVFPYPEFLLSNETVSGMKSGDRKAHL